MSVRYWLPLLGLSACVNAQENAVEHIRVTATRSDYPVSTVPATITVISQEQIRDQLAYTQDLSQIIGNIVPGFSPSRQKLTSSGETLRGRDPLYMIDGVPQSTPLRSGSRESNTIDTAMIERIEIIRGANAIQGMGASGGIINIITKSAGEFTHQFSAGYSAPVAGGRDSQHYKASYLHSITDEKLNLIAGASYRNTGMYRDGRGELIGVDVAQGDTMDSASYDGFIKGRYQLSSTQSIQVMLNHYQIRGNGDYDAVPGNIATDTPATSVKQEIEGDASRNKVTTLSVDYQQQNVWGGQLSWQLFLQDFAALYGGSYAVTFQDPAIAPRVFDQSQNKSKKYGSRFTFFKPSLAGSNLDLITGLDLLQDTTYQELALTGRKWVPETEYNNAAPFVQLRYDGLENWVFNVGARYEYGKLKVDDFTTLAAYNSAFVKGGSPTISDVLTNAGVVYQVMPSLRLYASYSEGFSMPDVGRVLRAIDQPGLSVDEFLGLEPIISDNLEFGFEYNGDWLRLQTSYFQSDSDFGMRLEADADGFYHVMREKTEISGFEAEGEVFISQNSTIGFSYARTTGRYDGDGDGVVESDLGGVNISPERFNIYWQHQWPQQISSRLQLNKLLDMEFNTGGKFNGYHTLDLSVRYEHNRLGAFTLGIENLADKYYITYYAQTTPADARYFAGMGRTASLSWQLAF
ncbi:TonB-dependent receptor [Chromatiaceae bacterium AAb-1]|nr:TonB-dependent receptor [Chromatiaceae bacterium AAb-1]